MKYPTVSINLIKVKTEIIPNHCNPLIFIGPRSTFRSVIGNSRKEDSYLVWSEFKKNRC